MCGRCAGWCALPAKFVLRRIGLGGNLQCAKPGMGVLAAARAASAVDSAAAGDADPRRNHNVRRVFLFKVLDGTFSSVFLGQLLSSYMFLLDNHSYRTVGGCAGPARQLEGGLGGFGWACSPSIEPHFQLLLFAPPGSSPTPGLAATAQGQRGYCSAHIALQSSNSPHLATIPRPCSCAPTPSIPTTPPKGAAQLILAFPSGYLADRWRRSRMLRLAGVVGLIALYVTITGFLQNALHIMFVSLPLWGAFYAAYSPAMESLFADSLAASPTRSRYFALKASILNFSLVGIRSFIYFPSTYGQ